MKDDPASLIRIGRLTARLIHDFKNQLGGLKLYVAYLKKRFADNAEAAQIVDKLVETVDAMAEQATLLAKLTMPIELRREQVDLARLVGATVTGLQAAAATRGVTIKIDAHTSPLLAFCDVQQLRIVLNAVVGRACAATPAGESVRIVLGGGAENGYLIEVTDGGERLSEPQCAALFELAADEKISRSALELALARRITEVHGGELTAWAFEDGTAVRLSLPSSGNGVIAD